PGALHKIVFIPGEEEGSASPVPGAERESNVPKRALGAGIGWGRPPLAGDHIMRESIDELRTREGDESAGSDSASWPHAETVRSSLDEDSVLMGRRLTSPEELCERLGKEPGGRWGAAPGVAGR